LCCADCSTARSLACRDCDPATYTDPADLRSEPIETELDLEYLVYGLFERSDRPDGAFLSKRWVPLEQLLESGGLGTLQAKIGEWEASRAARQKALVDAAFDAAAKAVDRANGSDSGSDSGSDAEEGEEGEEGGQDGGQEGEEVVGTLEQMCQRGAKRLRGLCADGAGVQEVVA
jgi:hypothetical protein